ncbi:MAG TPA: PadR family transcriptional regulator [Ktedonosporobacter sp.]|jgi:DNA-binding PadR family transcriptional regulator|nr:PadR family transcriptional regulator [Ktedonosporobacter sp.]
MYKHIMLLGLLLEKPMYGQQIREVIENHHDLFAETIKKPTIYYQLERLAADGYLEIRREQVEAPGPGAAHEDLALRERDVYYITEAGRHYFYTLLRAMLSQYTPGLSDLDACLYFLHRLSRNEATALLKERQDLVKNYRAVVLQQTESHSIVDEAHMLVNDHKLTLINAEIAWLERTINHLDTSPAQRT